MRLRGLVCSVSGLLQEYRDNRVMPTMARSWPQQQYPHPITSLFLKTGIRLPQDDVPRHRAERDKGALT